MILYMNIKVYINQNGDFINFNSKSDLIFSIEKIYSNEIDKDQF